MAEYFADDGTPNDAALAGLDRESKFHAAWEDLQDRLAAAKAGSDAEELRAAKLAVYNFRSYWRTVRDTAGTNPPGPAPETVTASARAEKKGN